MENTEKIKLTTEELEQISNIQKAGSTLVSQYGEIEYRTQLLNFQKDELNQKLNELKQEETRFAQAIENKYGRGSVDIETGEFTKF